MSTFIDETAAVPPVPPSVIHVGSLGGDTVTLDFVPGMTVQEYLDRAGTSVVGGQVPTLNAEPTALDVAPEPNSVLLVASRISNG